jgi:hypothetical protein
MADLVRGKFADEALDILRYQPHRGARMLEKGAEERPGECSRSRPESGPYGESGSSGGVGGTRRWRSDVQADPSSGPRHGLYDSRSVCPTFISPWKTLDE